MGECNFSWALDQLNQGFSIWRHGWNNNLQRVHKQTPDANSKMSFPYAYIEGTDAFGRTWRTPWVPSQGDLFATDWDCE